MRLWLWYARRALPHLDRQVLDVHQSAKPTLPPSYGWGGEPGGFARPLAWLSNGFGIGGDGCLIGILVTFILFALCGASLYVIASAPDFLGEAVVQLALAAALRRRGKTFDGEHWSGSILRATWGPALIVLTLAAVTGFYAQGSCPSAVSLFGAITQCRP